MSDIAVKTTGLTKIYADALAVNGLDLNQHPVRDLSGVLG